MKFRRKNLDLRFVLGLSIVISLILMIFEKSRELGLNFFTEITGVAITVFVINKILERKERKKRIAIDQRILRDVQSIIASYYSIWKHLVWKYLPDEKIESENDFVRIYSELVKRVNITDRFDVVSIHHPESWKLFFHNRTIKDCFENYRTTLSGEIQSFINDFKMFLEPELLDYLLNIMESEYFKNMYLMSQEGTEKVLAELELDTNQLGSYIDPDEKAHAHQFFHLIKYSIELRNMINRFTDVDVELYQVKKYFVHPSQFAL